MVPSDDGSLSGRDDAPRAEGLPPETFEKDRERIGRRSRWIGDRVRRARSGFWELLERRPLAVGAAVLAAGFLIGLALPSTRRDERDWGDRPDASPSIH